MQWSVPTAIMSLMWSFFHVATSIFLHICLASFLAVLVVLARPNGPYRPNVLGLGFYTEVVFCCLLQIFLLIFTPLTEESSYEGVWVSPIPLKTVFYPEPNCMGGRQCSPKCWFSWYFNDGIYLRIVLQYDSVLPLARGFRIGFHHQH